MPGVFSLIYYTLRALSLLALEELPLAWCFKSGDKFGVYCAITHVIEYCCDITHMIEYCCDITHVIEYCCEITKVVHIPTRKL